MSDAIQLERERGLLTLRLNRPGKKNALTRAMYSHLAQALKQADCDPEVNAVAGAAVGIGTTMLLHCDLVYVSRDARLRMPFVNIGLCPQFGSSLILPRLLGQAKAAELLLLGEGFSGEQAAQWGIATEALDSGDAVLAKAREMALRFESLPPEAVRISKQLMKAPDREHLRKAIEEERAQFTQRLRSPEAIAALTGFIKRH
ncbi:enoyl-CoA hydratase-related protein [Pseudomonas sp. Ma2-10]